MKHQIVLITGLVSAFVAVAASGAMISIYFSPVPNANALNIVTAVGLVATVAGTTAWCLSPKHDPHCPYCAALHEHITTSGAGTEEDPIRILNLTKKATDDGDDTDTP